MMRSTCCTSAALEYEEHQAKLQWTPVELMLLGKATAGLGTGALHKCVQQNKPYRKPQAKHK